VQFRDFTGTPNRFGGSGSTTSNDAEDWNGAHGIAMGCGDHVPLGQTPSLTVQSSLSKTRSLKCQSLRSGKKTFKNRKVVSPMHKVVNVIAASAFVSAIGVALLPRPAQAAGGNLECTVNSVSYQPWQTGVPYDLLLVGCSNSSLGFQIYVGPTPGVSPNVGCNADASAVQSMESILVAARLSGNPVQIYYSTISCSGNSGANIINYIAM
jgi:hypothetical protein